MVVRSDRVGDVVLSTPLIRALRKHFPDGYIAAMVRPHTAPVLAHNPHLDTLILDDYEAKDKGWKGFFKKMMEVRKHQFDTALMLLPTMRMAWMLFGAGIKKRIGVGHKIYEMLTFMQTVSRNKYNPVRHEADYCMDLGRAIGVKSEDLKPEVFLTDEEKNRGMAILKKRGISPNQIIVGINPGSGRSAPNWTRSQYNQLIERLIRHADMAVVLTGSRDEQRICDRIHEEAGGKTFNLAGQPLRELMIVINHFHVLVSSSTGPMHIAAALGVPTVSIFCPLPACSPQLWGPVGNQHEILLPPESVCLDCDQKGKCDLSTIDVDRVYHAILNFIHDRI
ncbi:glycosyltransferase family 9 protein [bacterium]|nr:glycosyltransferase family 9 protein [bacterium]